MPQKVAIYIRVSTQEQAVEGYSIEAQTERLTAYCKARDWPIVSVYSDPGFSGANTQRPALQKLFSDIDAGHVDCVLVYKLDRLSRSQKDTLFMIEDVFLAHDVAFVSMQENFDTSSPFGRAMIGILSVFAQLEREQIKERTSMGRSSRAKAGLYHGGGSRPFGYLYANGHLSVNEHEAVIVREVYSLFLARMPVYQIEIVIKEKFGIHLNHTRVHSILTSPLYIGLIPWMGERYQGKHDALVDEETFKKAQVLMHDRARIAASKPPPFRARHLLTGILSCGNCGAIYFVRHSRTKKTKVFAYYSCESRTRHRKKGEVVEAWCKNPTYRVEKLDAAVLAEVERLVSDEAYFRAVAGHSRDNNSAKIENDRRALMQRIDSLDFQISRVIDLYQLGTLDVTVVGQRTQKLQEEKAALQKTLDAMALPPVDGRLSVSEARTILADFPSVMATGDLETKRGFLQELIQRVIIRPVQGEIDIVWNF